MLPDSIGPSFVPACGWTLVHSIWVLAALYGLHLVAQAALRRSTAGTRYLAACGILAAMAVAIGLTFSIVRSGRLTFDFELQVLVNGQTALVNPPQRAWWTNLILRIEPAVQSITWVWAFVFVCRLLPIIGNIRAMRRITRDGELIDPAHVPGLEQLCQALLGGKMVRVLQDATLDGPATLGWWKPVILVPVGLLTELTPAQIERVIAHEIAHIRRHDYLINLLQTVMESVLFFHPCVGWIGRDIRALREAACDDIAIAVTGGSRKAFGEALLAAAAYTPPNPLVIGLESSSVEQRVIRLKMLQRRRPYRGAVQLLGILAGLFLLLMAASSTLADYTTQWREIDQLSRAGMGKTLLTLIDADRDNPDFVQAFWDVSTLVQNGVNTPDDRRRLDALADILAHGARSDTLLRAAVESFGPYDPFCPVSERTWPANVKLDPRKVTQYLFKIGFAHPDPDRRRQLVRAGLVLAGQSLLFDNPLSLHRALQYAQFRDVTGLSEKNCNVLRLTLSISGQQAVEQFRALTTWSRAQQAGQHVAIPEFKNLTTSSQMLLANLVAMARAKGMALDESTLPKDDPDLWVFNSVITNYTEMNARYIFLEIDD